MRALTNSSRRRQLKITSSAIIIFALAIGYIGYHYTYLPQNARNQILVKRGRILRMKLSVADNYAAQIVAKQHQYHYLISDLTPMLAQIPTHQDFVQLVKTIAHDIDTNHVRTGPLSFAVSASHYPHLTELAIPIHLTGTFPAVQKTLQDMLAYHRHISISIPTFTTADQGGARFVQARFTLKTYTYTGRRRP